nr:hypothetical protein [Pandoravirus massiliensis]
MLPAANARSAVVPSPDHAKTNDWLKKEEEKKSGGLAQSPPRAVTVAFHGPHCDFFWEKMFPCAGARHYALRVACHRPPFSWTREWHGRPSPPPNIKEKIRRRAPATRRQWWSSLVKKR